MLRTLEHNDWFVLILLLCLILVALAKDYDQKRFFAFLGVVFNSNYLGIFSKEQQSLNFFDVLLMANFILSFALFILFSLPVFGVFITHNEKPFALFAIMGSLLGFVLLKRLLEFTIGYLFNLRELIRFYLFQKNTFNYFEGILLIPLNILIIFTFSANAWFVYSMVFTIIGLNIIGFMKVMDAKSHEISPNFFYLILYICALEIAPYIFLIKGANSQV